MMELHDKEELCFPQLFNTSCKKVNTSLAWCGDSKHYAVHCLFLHSNYQSACNHLSLPLQAYIKLISKPICYFRHLIIFDSLLFIYLLFLQIFCYYMLLILLCLLAGSSAHPLTFSSSIAVWLSCGSPFDAFRHILKKKNHSWVNIMRFFMVF